MGASEYTDHDIQALIAENQKLKAEIEILRDKHRWQNSLDTNIFKLALSKVSDAVCMATVDGDVIYTNKEFREEYGVTDSLYLGKIYNLPISVPSKEEFDAKIELIRKNGGTYTYQDKYTNHRDGLKHYHQVSAFLMNTTEGEILGIFMQDITEIIKGRDELRELNLLMDVILDNLPVYLFVKDVDNDLRYLYWNKAFANYSKIPASRVIGYTDYEIFPSYDDAKKFRDDDIEVITTHEPINRHETYEAADGSTRIVQTLKTLCPREGRGPLLIGVSWDITNMQNIEQELLQERIRAEQSDRLKSTFLANMSHEIRTPLNAIVGFSNLLTQTDDAETKAQFAEIINQNSESLLQLINDILDISKIEAGTLEYVREPMDLAETFENIYESQKRRMQHGVKLVIDNDPEYPQVIVKEDRNRITQVVNNLINNAAKFTKEGSITFGYRVNEKEIEVFVKDTGIGIAPEKLSKVFDRFVKLNTFAQGTGLGLSICKLIVNLFGGKIWVESEQGHGSTFRFTIPYVYDRVVRKATQAKATQTEPQDKTQSFTNVENTGKKILVAEDNQSNFLLLKTLLGKRFDLLWAKDGGQAVTMFTESHPDLIFMDIKMPGMDGIEATRIIRSRSADVPIVALTAYAFQSDRQKALDAGMNDYLTKPLSMKALDNILSKYL